MSPEQTRGESVDKRADIWAFGCVLFEMLTGRAAFGGDTTSDTIAAILQSEPEWSALPAAIPSALRRLLQHCLQKDPRRRLRDIGDARLELDHRAAVSQEEEAGPSPQRLSGVQWWAVAALALVAVAAGWLVRDRREAPIDNPLANARFTPFTDFPGAERDAAISPDGKFVAFRSDRDGPFDAWLGQTDTGHFENLTQGKEDDLRLPVRSQGFYGDGSEVWLSGGVDRRLRLMPLVGRGEPRDFLGEMADQRRLVTGWRDAYVYHTREDGDPIFVADRNGANPRRIAIDQAGVHQHYPVWSLDGKWIYFVKGVQATYEWDLWRVAAAGGEPERLTQHESEVRISGADRPAHDPLRGARTRWLRALVVGPGCRPEADAPGELRSGEIHIAGSERRWPHAGGLGRQSDSELVECADPRSHRRGARRGALSVCRRREPSCRALVGHRCSTCLLVVRAMACGVIRTASRSRSGRGLKERYSSRQRSRPTVFGRSSCSGEVESSGCMSFPGMALKFNP